MPLKLWRPVDHNISSLRETQNISDEKRPTNAKIMKSIHKIISEKQSCNT